MRTIRTRVERFPTSQLPPEGPTLQLVVECGYQEIFGELLSKAARMTGPIAIVPEWIGHGPAPKPTPAQ